MVVFAVSALLIFALPGHCVADTQQETVLTFTALDSDAAYGPFPLKNDQTIELGATTFVLRTEGADSFTSSKASLNR